MNIAHPPTRSPLLRTLGILLASFATATNARADTDSFTPPAGYFQVSLRGASDHHVAVPLARKPVAFGRIASVTKDRITVTPAQWTAGAFASAAAIPHESFTVELASGDLAGITYQILDNTEDTLLLETRGQDLTAHPLGTLAYGDLLRIRADWTAASLFGASEDQLLLDPQSAPQAQADSVLLHDFETVGVNKPPVQELGFVHNVGWRAPGDAATDRARQAIGPAFVIRHRYLTEVKAAFLGYVRSSPAGMIVVGGSADAANDTVVGLLGPEPLALASSGLRDAAHPEKSVIRDSDNVLQPGDQLLAYSPTASGYRQAPDQIFFYVTGLGWRQVGSSSPDLGTAVLLEPGRAYVIRKQPGHGSLPWIQPPPN